MTDIGSDPPEVLAAYAEDARDRRWARNWFLFIGGYIAFCAALYFAFA